jgi:hypothetical protein
MSRNYEKFAIDVKLGAFARSSWLRPMTRLACRATAVRFLPGSLFVPERLTRFRLTDRDALWLRRGCKWLRVIDSFGCEKYNQAGRPGNPERAVRHREHGPPARTRPRVPESPSDTDEPKKGFARADT